MAHGCATGKKAPILVSPGKLRLTGFEVFADMIEKIYISHGVPINGTGFAKATLLYKVY